MIFALFPNETKAASLELANQVREWLEERGVQVVAEEEKARLIKAKPLASVDPASIDFMISMGGDGTILRVIHHNPMILAPILGINFGSLGFLADIPIDAIYASLQDLLNGAFRVQERLMMEGAINGGRRCFAVNEVVVHRGANPSMVDLAIQVDDHYLNTFAADGVIISTPSGSTAYSLAAGGPIISPDIEAIVITPISPHTISNRPIVLMPKKELAVLNLSEDSHADVSFDGIVNFTLAPGDSFIVRKSERRFRLVNLYHHDYFATLRGKLSWTGKLKR